jgi:transcriptional regulator with XRE-family HTH domain
MVISERLVALREKKKMTQGDIQNRTGLLRCYLSRLENGHTVPSIETLEKIANALEIPMYQLFYDGEKPPKVDQPAFRRSSKAQSWGTDGPDARLFSQFRTLMPKIDPAGRKLLMAMAQKMSRSPSKQRGRPRD